MENEMTEEEIIELFSMLEKSLDEFIAEEYPIEKYPNGIPTN